MRAHVCHVSAVCCVEKSDRVRIRLKPWSVSPLPGLLGDVLPHAFRSELSDYTPVFMEDHQDGTFWWRRRDPRLGRRPQARIHPPRLPPHRSTQPGQIRKQRRTPEKARSCCLRDLMITGHLVSSPAALRSLERVPGTRLWPSLPDRS